MTYLDAAWAIYQEALNAQELTLRRCVNNMTAEQRLKLDGVGPLTQLLTLACDLAAELCDGEGTEAAGKFDRALVSVGVVSTTATLMRAMDELAGHMMLQLIDGSDGALAELMGRTLENTHNAAPLPDGRLVPRQFYDALAGHAERIAENTLTVADGKAHRQLLEDALVTTSPLLSCAAGWRLYGSLLATVEAAGGGAAGATIAALRLNL